MHEKPNPKTKASHKAAMLPPPKKNNQNLKFGRFFRGAMVFGKYM